MIRVIFTILFFSYHFSSIGQVITGNLSLLPNQYVYLEGFGGYILPTDKIYPPSILKINPID